MTPPVPRPHTLRNVALFLISLVATTTLLRHSLPSGESDLLQAKLSSFASKTGENAFNLAFVGSSRTYHGFVPEIFDQHMAAQGFDIRSYNLGISGLRIEGTYDALESLRDRKPENLRWVFIDPESTHMLVVPQKRRMKGVVRWHDPTTTWLMLRYLWASDKSFEKKLDLGNEMVMACCYDTVNLGRGVPLIDELLERSIDEEMTAYRIGPREDGFRAKDDARGEGVRKAHQKFLDTFPNFRHDVALYAREDPSDEPLTPEGLPLIRRIEDLVRDMGAEPIFVIVPSQTLQGQLINAHEQGEIGQLFRYNDPKAYPEFYSKAARWEVAHLSLHGARLFTKQLANDFAEYLKSQEDGE